MPCKHRFIKDLYPKYELRHLFVGTFNPSWDREDNDNADWFYGRTRNHFWYIMPQVFGDESLIDYKNDREFLMKWCENHNIGITDLIENIQDANIDDECHKEKILSVKDNVFDFFKEIKSTNIIQIINENKAALRKGGVYLTRYEHTLPKNGILKKMWEEAKETCNNLEIPCDALATPSGGYFKITREEKIKNWKEKLNKI